MTKLIVIVGALLGGTTLFAEVGNGWSDFMTVPGKKASPIAIEQKSSSPEAVDAGLHLTVKSLPSQLEFTIQSTLSNSPTSGSLSIYDVSGRQIHSMSIQVGKSTRATWNLKNSQGHRVSAGSYFGRLTVGTTKVSQNFIIL